MISSGFTTMKTGDYGNPHSNKTFFPSLQQQQQQQQQLSLFQQRALAQKRECNSDDVEVNSRSTGGEPNPAIPLPTPSDPKKQKKSGEGGGDEGSIEVVRRPRGRPPGSKNKPKPSVAASPTDSSPDDAMRPHVLEVPAGHDVTDSLVRFSRRRDVGLWVLSGTGPVSNVTIRQLSASGGSTLMIPGRFELLSISATFLPPSFPASSGMVSMPGAVSISLAGPKGQILGGIVSGPLVAAGTVTIVAAAFSNPSFHRLPMEGDQSVSVSGDGGRSGGDVEAYHQHQHHHQQQLQHQHQHRATGAGSLAEASGAMSIYSSHHPSDVIWTPTARAPPPPPPPF